MPDNSKAIQDLRDAQDDLRRAQERVESAQRRLKEEQEKPQSAADRVFRNFQKGDGGGWLDDYHFPYRSDCSVVFSSAPASLGVDRKPYGFPVGNKTIAESLNHRKGVPSEVLDELREFAALSLEYWVYHRFACLTQAERQLAETALHLKQACAGE